MDFSKNLDLAAEEFGYNIIKFCSRLVTKWGTRSQNVSRACFCALLVSPDFFYIKMELKPFWSRNIIYLIYEKLLFHNRSFHDRPSHNWPFYNRPSYKQPSHNRLSHDHLSHNRPSHDLNNQTLTNKQTYLQILEAKTLLLLPKKDLNDVISFYLGLTPDSWWIWCFFLPPEGGFGGAHFGTFPGTLHFKKTFTTLCSICCFFPWLASSFYFPPTFCLQLIPRMPEAVVNLSPSHYIMVQLYYQILAFSQGLTLSTEG